MSVKPLHDRVLVKRIDVETKTAGGIIIPDGKTEKPSQGEVIALGQGYRGDDGSFSSLSVKEGETVLFGKYAGVEIKIEGQELLIMKESDIIGIML